MKFSSEEKDKIRQFVTPDLRPSFSLFKDKELHPEDYPLKEHKVAVNKRMLSYLEQFKDKIVKS